MSTPKTWDLILSCETCLKNITTANGYYTNVGNFVSTEPSNIPEAQGLCVALLMESVAQPTDPALRNIGLSVPLLIVAKVSTEQDDAQLRLHELIDDLMRCFDNQQALFATGTRFPVFVSAQPIPPQDGLLWVGVELRFATQIRIK